MPGQSGLIVSSVLRFIVSRCTRILDQRRGFSLPSYSSVRWPCNTASTTVRCVSPDLRLCCVESIVRDIMQSINLSRTSWNANDNCKLRADLRDVRYAGYGMSNTRKDIQYSNGNLVVHLVSPRVHFSPLHPLVQSVLLYRH